MVGQHTERLTHIDEPFDFYRSTCASGWSGYPARQSGSGSDRANGWGVAAENAVPGEKEKVIEQPKRGRRPKPLKPSWIAHRVIRFSDGVTFQATFAPQWPNAKSTPTSFMLCCALANIYRPGTNYSGLRERRFRLGLAICERLPKKHDLRNIHQPKRLLPTAGEARNTHPQL